jgi:hypothetical protein
MEDVMKRSLSLACLFVFLVTSFAAGAFAGSYGKGQAVEPAASYADPFQINIMVSPNVIALDSDTEWLTIHTDIPLSAVDTASLKVNDIDVSWTKADNQGNLVAKFDMVAVKAILVPGEAVLVLTGLTEEGVSFSGTDTVEVRDNL